MHKKGFLKILSKFYMPTFSSHSNEPSKFSNSLKSKSIWINSTKQEDGLQPILGSLGQIFSTKIKNLKLLWLIKKVRNQIGNFILNHKNSRNRGQIIFKLNVWYVIANVFSKLWHYFWNFLNPNYMQKLWTYRIVWFIIWGKK